MTLPPDVLAEVATAGARDAGGVPVELLGDFLETLSARKLKASFAVNGTACELYREACQAAHEAGFHAGMTFGFCIAAIGAVVGVLLWHLGVSVAY